MQFGPDGALYISDWVDGWSGEGKGRIYRYSYAEKNAKLVQEVQEFLAADIAEMATEMLAQKLSHVDRRLRQKSQLELAQRGELEVLTRVALEGNSLLERLHGVWGLDHLARMQPRTLAKSAEVWMKLARDEESEIRANAIRLLGEFHQQQAADLVMKSLQDAEPRVRHFALTSSAKLGLKSALGVVVDGIVENAGKDPILRHAAIMALVGIADASELAQLKTHGDPLVRLSAVVALRRLKNAAVSEFLADEDELVVAEAARAIHDAPIDSAMSELAKLIEQPYKTNLLFVVCWMPTIA